MRHKEVYCYHSVVKQHSWYQAWPIIKRDGNQVSQSDIEANTSSGRCQQARENTHDSGLVLLNG